MDIHTLVILITVLVLASLTNGQVNWAHFCAYHFRNGFLCWLGIILYGILYLVTMSFCVYVFINYGDKL